MTDDDGHHTLPDGVRSLHDAVGAARRDLGERHPTTVWLRARLTRVLIELGRDADAAQFEARRLERSRRGKEAG